VKSLDTNLLLRLILSDIPEQTKAVNALFDDVAQKYFVADMAFAEIVWVLSGTPYGYNRERIAANVQSVVGIPQISCNRAMLEKAVPLYVSHPSISFIDACLAIYAELNGTTPLLTFDKKLVKALPKIAARL